MHARVYVHDGMTAAMVHRDGNTQATIDQALDEGPEIVAALAAEIAGERGLPDHWLGRLGAEPPTVSTQRRMTIRERSLQIFLRTSARLAERCVAVARQPHANMLKKRIALAGIRIVGLAVKLVRRMSWRAVQVASDEGVPAQSAATRPWAGPRLEGNAVGVHVMTNAGTTAEREKVTADDHRRVMIEYLRESHQEITRLLDDADFDDSFP